MQSRTPLDAPFVVSEFLFCLALPCWGYMRNGEYKTVDEITWRIMVTEGQPRDEKVKCPVNIIGRDSPEKEIKSHKLGIQDKSGLLPFTSALSKGK